MKNRQFFSGFSFNQVITLLLVGLLFYSAFIYFQSNSNERLFVQYFEPAENSFISFRGDDSPQSPALEKAMVFYENENFEAALPHFENHLISKADDFKAMLYAGISHLKSYQLNKSIALLKTTRINAPKYFEEAGWYLALAHIRNEQLEDATLILQEIVESGETVYMEKADALLEEIGG